MIQRNDIIIDLIKSIRKEAQKNAFAKVFELASELNEHIQDDNFYSDLAGLKGKYIVNEQNFHNAIISHEQANIERNRIISALLEILDKIEADAKTKNKIETNIAFAEIEKAIKRLLELAKTQYFTKKYYCYPHDFTTLKNRPKKEKYFPQHKIYLLQSLKKSATFIEKLLIANNTKTNKTKHKSRILCLLNYS